MTAFWEGDAVFSSVSKMAFSPAAWKHALQSTRKHEPPFLSCRQHGCPMLRRRKLEMITVSCDWPESVPTQMVMTDGRRIWASVAGACLPICIVTYRAGVRRVCCNVWSSARSSRALADQSSELRCEILSVGELVRPFRKRRVLIRRYCNVFRRRATSQSARLRFERASVAPSRSCCMCGWLRHACVACDCRSHAFAA